jgi:predicted amidohydrolase YtcJ
MYRFSIPLIAIAFLVACSRPPGADIVFMNGAVYTVDEHRSWVESVAVTDGAIIYVGTNDGAREYIGADTVVRDLDGQMLMPGFHDGHAHVLYGGSAESECDLQYEFDVDRIRGLLINCLEEYDYGSEEWVIGGQWPPGAFPDMNPSKDMLDEIFGRRPVVLSDAFGHNAWVNSRALEIAGIDSNTADPPQGVIVRDAATGQPSGTLRDAAMDLVFRHVPEETDEERYAALMAGLKQANAFGITAYIEPGENEKGLEPYIQTDRRGELSARVVVSLSPIGLLPDRFGPEIFDLLAKRDQFRGRYLDVDSVKVYIDGVIETETSHMLQPYQGGGNFPPFYEPEELGALYQRLDSMGLQIHTHAIGDAAIRMALDAYEHALLANGPNDNRHQIVHLQLIDDDDIPRFAVLNVAANFQCLWCFPDIYVDWAVPIVGNDRVQKFYPVRRIQETGAMLVGGSDWNVTSLNPLDAIETAVRRQDPDAESGRVLGSNEEVDLATALDMYTRNAAYIMRLEHKSGSIEVGKRADLIVIDRNLFEIPVTEINEARVLLTLLDGEPVYGEL